jgi:hypothetical protein
VHSFAADTDDREILQIFARMNSTGVKLNPQELRNAEFYGEFKQLAYELATEQLNRWRTWDIFTPNQIARMAEVELTSEFMILIMNGITGKSKASIDNIYKQFDSELPDGAEISARLRETFDAIASTFAADEIARFFSKVSVFYALFARVYDLRYGIRDPARDYEALPKAKPKPLSAAAVSRMHNAAQAIYFDGDVPAPVARALRGATVDTASRRLIIGFLAGEDNDPWQARN